MAKKKLTLPKNFEELLEKANLSELIEIFDTYELDARGGYSKETALAFDNCPHELAKWLIEKGSNIQALDAYQNTPLHSRSRSYKGNIQSLLELGADVNDNRSSDGTPLHAAADSHNAPNTKLLVEFGADVNAINARGYSPLEEALSSCTNIDIEQMVQISKILLNAKAQKTPRMKNFVTEIGKRFEFMRPNFNKDSVDQVSAALDELYQIFEVEPVAKRVMHDGKATITVKAKTWQKQHQELWEWLVPASGAAQTMQGEVIRISGRIARELLDNGGINWDQDYKIMADTFYEFIQEGNPFSIAETNNIHALIKKVKQRSGDADRLMEIGVKWVMNNPTPIKLPPIKYDR